VANLWCRAGLAEVAVEELRWLDAVVRREVPMVLRPIARHLRWFLITGTRPAGGPSDVD